MNGSKAYAHGSHALRLPSSDSPETCMGNAIMLHPLIIGLIVFAVVLAGALVGFGTQATPASASPRGRDKKPRLGLHGSGCHDFSAGARATDRKRKRVL